MLIELVKNAVSVLRWRAALLIIVTLAGAAFDGIGLSLLFPIMAQFGVAGAQEGNPLARLIDRVLAFFHVPNALGSLLAVLVGVFLVQVGLTFVRAWLEADCQTRYTSYWQRRLFDGFMRARWQFFISERSATRVNAIMVEAGRTSAAFYLVAQMLTAVAVMAVYATISIAASWQMVVVLVVFGGALYVAIRPLGRRGTAIGERVSVVSEALQHRATEFLQNAKLIKTTATEQLAQTIFAKASDDYRRGFRLAAVHPAMINAIYMACGYAFFGFAVWFTIDKLAVNPASIIVGIYVFLRLYVQMTNFHQLRHSFVITATGLPAAVAQLNEATRLAEATHGGVALATTGPVGLRLDHATVRYGDKLALDEVTCDIVAGTVVGVTGASGAGKSTLVDLIVGLVEPASGSVVVEGVPIAKLDLSPWRRSIGYVGQDTLLLNDTVGQNIAWGIPDASPAAIEEAARLASAHDFIAELPRGYATEIGERGVRLSGGQRQRLGLARALLGGRRLLILDEATSALDSESEYQILSALESLRGRVTILSVAHRLSTLRGADRILILERGRLVEAGTWAELTARGGPFSRLWELQNTSPDFAARAAVEE
jgi:ABC-type multidrug transport system fused ATPase/permease subunit